MIVMNNKMLVKLNKQTINYPRLNKKQNFRMWFKYGHPFIVSTMPFHLHSYSFIFHERYDYMTLRKGKSKKRDAFFSIPA